MLYDFYCVKCDHTFEDLQNHDDPLPNCPQCQNPAERVLFCNSPTAPASPKYIEIHRKAVLMKKRMTGQLPWRKHSESQTD
jgi:putative FmdB family regulatory protein